MNSFWEHSQTKKLREENSKLEMCKTICSQTSIQYYIYACFFVSTDFIRYSINLCLFSVKINVKDKSID